MTERELQEAHARIIQLEQELTTEKDKHRRTTEHSKRWEKRAKRNRALLLRIKEVLEHE